MSSSRDNQVIDNTPPLFLDIILKHILSWIPLRDREQTRKALRYTAKTLFKNATFDLYKKNSREVLTAIANLARLYERDKVAVVIYGEAAGEKLGEYQFALSQPMRGLVVFEALEFKPYTIIDKTGQLQTIPAQRNKHQREFNDVVIAFPSTVEEAEKICRDYFRIGEFTAGEKRRAAVTGEGTREQINTPYQTNLVLVAPAEHKLGLNFDGVIKAIEVELQTDQHIHSLYLSAETYPKCTEDKYGDKLLREVLYAVAKNEKGHKPLSHSVERSISRNINNPTYANTKYLALIDRIENFCQNHFGVKLNIETSQINKQIIQSVPWLYLNSGLALLNLLEWSHLLDGYRSEECLYFTKLALHSNKNHNNYSLHLFCRDYYTIIASQKGSTKEKLVAVLDSSVCKGVLHMRTYLPIFYKSTNEYLGFLAYVQKLSYAQDLIRITKDHSTTIKANKRLIDACDPYRIDSLNLDILQLDIQRSFLRAANDFYLATHQSATADAGAELWDKLTPLLTLLSDDVDIIISRKKDRTDDNNKRTSFLFLLMSATELLHNPLSLAHVESLNKNIALVEKAFSSCKNKRLRELLSIALRAIILLTTFTLISILAIHVTSMDLIAAAYVAFFGYVLASITVLPLLFPKGFETTSVPLTEKSNELKVAVDACKQLSKSKAGLFAIENKAGATVSSRNRDSSIKCDERRGNHATA